jgi:hypothetical protein
VTDDGKPLDAAISDLMQRIIDINDRWPGDYALFVQSACTEEATCMSFAWYYKPPSAGAQGDMVMLAGRPPGYETAGGSEAPAEQEP